MPSAQPAAAPSTSVDLEQETIAYWVEVATTLGFPRSLGEIFGVLFVSPEPLNADDIVARLSMSRSGVGQGLKILAEMGAIRHTLSLGGRKDHFELQTDLGVLVRLFLASRVLPKIDEFGRRRKCLAERSRTADHGHLIARFEKLDRWRGKTKPLFAILKSLASE